MRQYGHFWNTFIGYIGKTMVKIDMSSKRKRVLEMELPGKMITNEVYGCGEGGHSGG